MERCKGQFRSHRQYKNSKKHSVKTVETHCKNALEHRHDMRVLVPVGIEVIVSEMDDLTCNQRASQSWHKMIDDLLLMCMMYVLCNT